MPRLAKQKIKAIQREVLSWYAVNKRDLPWRGTQDPYAILVSEIMLQQTQVSRVIPKYREFLEQFPTVQALAAASPATVIRSWKELGYNRRALNLQRAARMIVERAKISPDPSFEKRRTSPFAKGDRGGFDAREMFPQTVEEFIQLPGIGRYTAAAVATFAFGVIEPAVDTNVRQFIDVMVPTRRKRTERDYYTLAAQLIPPDRPVEWLHAIMDYSSLVLRPSSQVQPQGLKKRRLRQHSKQRPSHEPFIGSNRYLRGRTIDLLREAAAVGLVLFRRVAQPVAVGEDRYQAILEALVREGLIEKARGRYQLKEL